MLETKINISEIDPGIALEMIAIPNKNANLDFNHCRIRIINRLSDSVFLVKVLSGDHKGKEINIDLLNATNWEFRIIEWDD